MTCKCGCGEMPKAGNAYLLGHNRRGVRLAGVAQRMVAPVGPPLLTRGRTSDGRATRDKPYEIASRGDGSSTVTLGNGASVILDDVDLVMLRQWRVVISSSRSVTVLLRKSERVSIQLHRLLMNPAPDELVDHINGDAYDNRRCNLRVCTPAQNNKNMALNSTNTTGFKGVNMTKTGRFRAYATHGIATYHLGFYATGEEAARAYDAFARANFGEFCCLNFPEDGEQSVHRERRNSAISEV